MRSNKFEGANVLGRILWWLCLAMGCTMTAPDGSTISAGLEFKA